VTVLGDEHGDFIRSYIIFVRICSGRSLAGIVVSNSIRVMEFFL
jgi:hypothetical protein